MANFSLGEWLFLALGVGGFVRFGWCLVWLIGDEAPMPAPLDWALDALVGAALAAVKRARPKAVTAALAALLLPATEGATR
jgi:hypothetical protein